MSTYWAEYAWLGNRVEAGVRLSCEAGRWTAIEPDSIRQDTDRVLSGLALPGFANLHSHAFHRGLRGRTHGNGGTFWTWRDEMYRLAAKLTPDNYYQLATAVYAEMVAAGYTSVGEFHYLHHRPDGGAYADPNAMGKALIAAAQDAGIRLTLLDVCYLQGGLRDGRYLPLDEVQRRFSDGSVAAWADRVAALAAEQPAAVVGSAAHSVRALTPAELTEFSAASRRIAGPLHLHLSEQPAENAEVERAHGMSPAGLGAACGVLQPGTVAVHATHLSDQDLDIFADRHAAVCMCPTTERDLADGIGRTGRLREKDIPIGIGSDQHAVVDPFDELRCLEGHERLASHRRGNFTPAELVGIAAAHHLIGWEDCGQLRPGACADAVVVDLGSARTAGCDLNQICYAASASDVTDVIIGGDFVVRDGKHRIGDIGELLSRALQQIK